MDIVTDSVNPCGRVSEAAEAFILRSNDAVPGSNAAYLYCMYLYLLLNVYTPNYRYPVYTYRTG
jgi:hypothetical protein